MRNEKTDSWVAAMEPDSKLHGHFGKLPCVRIEMQGIPRVAKIQAALFECNRGHPVKRR